MNGDHSLPADFRGIIEECVHRAMDEDVEGVPEWERFRVVSDDVGIFLYLLARGTKRKHVVELDGTGGAGSSVVWLSSAMQAVDGTVTAWESNPRRWVKLQNSLSRARLSPSVELRTLDPLFRESDEGPVIAPPVTDTAELNGLRELETFDCDMAVVSLTEQDWPDRISYAWDILGTNGLIVLIDTLQVGDYAETILGDFLGTRDAVAIGIRMGEGLVIALKLSDTCDIDEIPETAMVGEKAHGVLKDLERRNSKPESKLWAIPPITGTFLWMLVSAMGARDVLEIGASSGYSGIWIASALRKTGGRLTTMDIDPEKVRMAGESYKKAGVDDLVTILEGDAREIVPTIDRQFDLIFLDSDKEAYYDLIEPVLWRIMRGGLLIADNVISHRDELGAYLDEVKRHANLMSVTVPVGSGEEMTMVL